MRVIYKYSLVTTGSDIPKTTLKLPFFHLRDVDPVLLHAGLDLSGNICVWVEQEVEKDAPLGEYSVYLVPTGKPIPNWG